MAERVVEVCFFPSNHHAPARSGDSACSAVSDSNVIQFASPALAAATSDGQYRTGMERRRRMDAACSVETPMAWPTFEGPPKARKTSSKVCMTPDSTFCTAPRQGETYSAAMYSPGMTELARQIVPILDEPGERLRWARERAGFKTASDAARRFGWNENTYRSNENGQRDFSKRKAAVYAKAFKVTVAWLIQGEGAMTPPPDPEMVTLWGSLTEAQQAHVKRFMRMLREEQEAA